MFCGAIGESHNGMQAVVELYLYRLTPPVPTYGAYIVLPHTVEIEVSAVFWMLTPIEVDLNYIVH